MNDRTLTLPTDVTARLDNLARRLGLPLDEALGQIAGHMDLVDRIAEALAVPIVASHTPLRLRPATAISPEIADIDVFMNLIATVLPHADERFTAVVRRLHYRWDGDRWLRVIRKFAEPLSDRAVELGVHLLAAGFAIEVHSEALQCRIANSDYQPETRTWVQARTTGKFAGWFDIRWDRDASDYYQAAALISGSHCYPGSAIAPAHSYDEVLDFAEMHGFAVSDGALDLAKQARHERDAMLLVSPQIQNQAPDRKPDPEPEIHEGILDELADAPF